ncbi:hypothetical protein AB4Z46_10225 [Variovorax sp. M-6]|uniref:hypothetical protein n=1 Tax=Variovorax sp. M-6 TaxID=3233041 RepID=UPI003F9A7C96
MGIIGRLFGDKRKHAPRDEEVERMVARVVGLSPRLRLAQGHEARLTSAIAKAAAHLRELVAAFPSPRALSPASWAADSYVRAFFGAADDVGPALGRSTELYTFFEQQPGLNEAFAVLGMAMNERRTLGVAQEGDVTRSDVAQTTLSFSDHQIRICAPSDAELRQEIGRRMVDQLAIEGLARMAADTSRRDDLEQERALVAARLRLLERQGVGMQSVLGGGGEVDTGELARLRVQLEENDKELQNLGSRSEALDRQLDRVCEVFADAGALIHVSARSLRLSRMNVVLPEQGADDGHTLDLEIARVPGDPPRERAFALVRVARVDVPKPRNLLDEAARLL